MNNDLDSLEAIGFKKAGKWELDGKKIKAVWDGTEEKLKNVLYAFVVDKEVKYVGKTSKTLKGRMGVYRNKGKKLLVKVRKYHDKGVYIYVLTNYDVNKEKASSLMNDIMGLEDVLIREMSPEWNTLGKEKEND